MSLEAYTGKIKDLVITNPTPTDPKSQGDDHLRGIKKTIVDDAVRVSGSPLQQMGDKATAGENHFWDASTANQLSLKRGTPEAPGTNVISVVNGGVAALTFANPTVPAPDANTLNCYRFSGQLTGTTGISSEAGTLGGYSWIARYSRIGRLVTVHMSINISSVGSGDGAITINPIICGLPSSWAGSQIAHGSGRRSSDGMMLQAGISNGGINILKYDNTTAIAATTLAFSIAYDTNDA